MPDLPADAPDRALAHSWEANADAWTAAVRERLIASRRAGTDAAVLDAVARALPNESGGARAVLDVGCGEGWLTRALAARGLRALGVDGSAPLVVRAREADPGGTYAVASYDDLVRDPLLAAGPFDVVVLNYALFAERVAPLLRALAGRLAPGGAVVIQTVHPWAAAGEAGYRDGWREETFAKFGPAFPAPMPWYFRTLASWVAELREAGLAIERLDEPVDAATGRVLSLVVTCVRVAAE